MTLHINDATGRGLALRQMRDEVRDMHAECVDKSDTTSDDRPNDWMRMATRLEQMERRLDGLIRGAQ